MNSPTRMCRGGLRRITTLQASRFTRGPCRTTKKRGEDAASTRGDELDGYAFYRRHTESLLRRYVRMSMQIGRVPSCLPQEYLRTRSSFRQGANFEDGVIFVHDMERCLGKLDRVSGELVERIGIQEYSRREAAQILGMSHGQLSRSYDDAIDRLTEILLGHQLIRQRSASY